MPVPSSKLTSPLLNFVEIVSRASTDWFSLNAKIPKCITISATDFVFIIKSPASIIKNYQEVHVIVKIRVHQST